MNFEKHSVTLLNLRALTFDLLHAQSFEATTGWRRYEKLSCCVKTQGKEPSDLECVKVR